MRCHPRLIAVLAGGALVAFAAGATSASGAVRIGNWGTITADMAGPTLVWSDTQVAKTRTFTYWRTDAARARVSGTRIRGVTGPVAVRTSAGPITGAAIRATGVARGFVLTASGAQFAGPVTWCCSTGGTEVVLSSDGDGAAPHPYGAGLDGARVRWIAAAPGGAGGAVLGSADPVESAERVTVAEIPGRPGPRLASVGRGIAAWADVGGTTVRWGTPSDGGVDGIREAAQGGRVLEVRAVPGFIVSVVRRGGYRVTRTDAASGAVKVLWRGSVRPQVGAGGRAVVIGAGRAVLTSRGGRARKVTDARGPIAAIATNGTRVAVFERVSRTAKVKGRTKTVRTTEVRIAGRVR